MKFKEIIQLNEALSDNKELMKKLEREEEKDTYFLSERCFGTFERSLSLPDTIDENKLEARFSNGVLKIFAPKKPGSQKIEKKIEIKKP